MKALITKIEYLEKKIKDQSRTIFLLEKQVESYGRKIGELQYLHSKVERLKEDHTKLQEFVLKQFTVTDEYKKQK